MAGARGEAIEVREIAGARAWHVRCVGQNVMQLSKADRLQVLRFAASFVWADLEVRAPERRFLSHLADELAVDRTELPRLLALPPTAEEIDPASVSRAAAVAVRSAALRAIASDGHVDAAEMTMFELLDDLLPR